MNDRNAFRPEVAGLEARSLLSAGASRVAHTHARPLPAAVVLAAQAEVVPTTGSFINPAGWMALHREFVTRAAEEQPRVVFLGDSITYFWTDAGHTPATSALRSRFLPPRGSAPWAETFAPLDAANFGIPGDETGNLLWRVGHGELAGRPRVAVVLIGTNDLLQGKPPAEVVGGTIDVVQAIRAVSPETRVLLLGVLPGGPAPGDPTPAQVGEVNATLAAWSRRNHITFVNLGRALAPTIDAQNHPTDGGYQVFADALAPHVRRLLS